MKLKGYLSIVDKYGKLHFTYLPNEDETGKKDNTHSKLTQILEKHVQNGRIVPFDNDGFYVKIRKNDIEMYQMLIGRQVNVKVKMYEYNFKSKLQDNYGEFISGVGFNLIELYPITEI